LAATVCGDNVLLFGGYSAAGQVLNTAYSYDPRNDTYKLIAPMPVANRGHCATTIAGDKVLLLGGTPLEPHACVYDPAQVLLFIASPIPFLKLLV
jgi:N-acetylneuraminic acid mutarotase